MPILNIEIVGEISHTNTLVQEIANAAGEALGSKPQGTWVKLSFVSPSLYAENEGEDVTGIQPVIVSLIMATLPLGDELQTLVTKLTDVIARITKRPSENIHIIFEPPALGRISFGGKLQT